MIENKAYLLDTDIVIYWLKNKYPSIDTQIRQINNEFVFISSITAAELYYGAFNSVKKDENVRLIDDLLENIT